MRKGFIFSLDAALALIVVIMVGGLLVMYFQVAEPKAGAYAASDRIAEDAAVVGFYLGKDAGQMGLSGTLPSDEFASCSVVYGYEIRVNSTWSSPIEKKYCKGM